MITSVMLTAPSGPTAMPKTITTHGSVRHRPAVRRVGQRHERQRALESALRLLQRDVGFLH